MTAAAPGSGHCRVIRAPPPAAAVAASGAPEAPGWRDCWRADRGDAGGRLDRAILRHLAGAAGLSRNQVQGWIGAGRVLVNGAAVARPARRLALGDALEISLPASPPPRRRSLPLVAQQLPLSILFEDGHLLALDKPAGLVVHPTGRYRDGTLVNALAWYLGAEASGGAGERAAVPPIRPGLVHRLDRDTTGLLLVAKSRAAHAGLARAIRSRAMQKDYLAVVYGRAPHAKGRIELRLHRDPSDPRRVAASRTEGLAAVTLFEVLAEGDAGGESARLGVRLSLLRCRLLTGRTHQIRAHLAALGLPIVGDPLYGEPRHRGIADPALAALCRDFPRQALHAWRLALPHPVSDEPLALQAPVPADLAPLLAAAGWADGKAAAGRIRQVLAPA